MPFKGNGKITPLETNIDDLNEALQKAKDAVNSAVDAYKKLYKKKGADLSQVKSDIILEGKKFVAVLDKIIEYWKTH